MAPVPEKMTTEDRGLRDIFNAAMLGAHRDFPEVKGRLSVYNMVDNRIHGIIKPEDVGMKNEKELSAFYKGAKASAGKLKSSIATTGKQAMVIVYNTSSLNSRLFTTAAQPKEMSVLATFDHELGHLMIKDALKYSTLSEKLYSEAAADTYAVIRNIQRFGAKAQGTDVISWQRASSFIEHGIQSHFTSFTLDEFARVQNRIDFAALTPRESLQLAQRFAEEFTPHENTMHSLLTAFEPYRAALKENPKDRPAALKVLADITMSDTADYYTFKLGARVLEMYLDDRASFGGQTLKLRSNYWSGVRRGIALREMQLAKEGILAGFPLKVKSPANTNRFGIPPRG